MTDTKNTVSDELSEKFGTWLAAHGTPDQIDSYNSYFEREIAPLIRASIPGGVGVKGEIAASINRITAIVEGLYGFVDLGPNSPEELKANWAKWCEEKAKAWALVNSTLGLSPAEGEQYTPEDGLRRAREIALQSEAAPLSMGEIVKVADMALGEETPMPEWMTHPDFCAAPSNPVISDEMLFTTIQDAYLRGLDWGRKYSSTEAEELKASYDYADKTTTALSVKPQSQGENG